MAGIVKKSLDRPDELLEFVHERAGLIRVGEDEVWPSELTPGWTGTRTWSRMPRVQPPAR